MSYLEVRNLAGSIVLTDTFKNLQFIAKGETLIPAYQGNPALAPEPVYLNVGTIKPIVAARCADSNKAIAASVMRHRSGSLWDGTYDIEFVSTKGDTIVEYFIFNYTNNLPGTFFEIRNESGEVIFSDNMRSMKVVGQRTDSLSTTPSPGTILSTMAHSDTTKVACVFGDILCLEVSYPSGPLMRYNRVYSLCRFNGNSVDIVFLEIYSAQLPGSFPFINIFKKNYNLLFVDVTGL